MDGFWRQLQASFVNAAKRQCYYGCAIRALVLAGGRNSTASTQWGRYLDFVSRNRPAMRFLTTMVVCSGKANNFGGSAGEPNLFGGAVPGKSCKKRAQDCAPAGPCELVMVLCR